MQVERVSSSHFTSDFREADGFLDGTAQRTMQSWKRHLIESYRWATMPYRSLRAAEFRRQLNFPIGVLFYHRIADQHVTDWTMTREQFVTQLDWIAKRFEFISLSEAQRRLSRGQSPRPAICITFDDGYADNNRDALPLLIRRQIPVTYFVSLDHVVHDTPFPHDEKLGLDLPRNTLDSLRALAHCGVEIGAHTRTHCDFSKRLTDEQVFDEVVAATNELSRLIEKPVRYLAIPYGQREHLDPRVFQRARELGLRGVCSAYGGFNRIGDDTFHLSRIHGDPELPRLKNWLTWDPRQLRRSRKPRIAIQSDSWPKTSNLEPSLADRKVAPQPTTHALTGD